MKDISCPESLQKRISVPAKDALSSKQVCSAVEMLTLVVVDLAPCDLAVLILGVMKNPNVKPRLMSCILQCTRKGLQQNVYNARWCMHKKGTVQGSALICRCMLMTLLYLALLEGNLSFCLLLHAFKNPCKIQ